MKKPKVERVQFMDLSKERQAIATAHALKIGYALHEVSRLWFAFDDTNKVISTLDKNLL